VIDAAVVLVGVLGVWAGSALARFILHPARFSFPSPSVLLSTTAYLGAAFLYLTAAWALTGRTCGAEVMGLRVQRGDGRRPGWLVSAARAALYIAFPVGLVWTAVSRRARSLQDLVVGTSVVYDWGRVGSPPAGVT
jgi:uncharacterized RDD family membrane protein YckC